MANRINRALELLQADQPVFYYGGHTGFDLSHENGVEQAGTKADYINIGMEHGAFDMPGLERFMKGLLDGGPTRSGHRTPTVIVEAPVIGESEEAIRYNTWQFRQILGRGVHGILLCHAESPAAVKAFVEVCRFPRNLAGVGAGLDVGTRGVGGQAIPAEIWGIDSDQYVDKADPWPLNPDGELMLGLKIENIRALNQVEATLKIPGIAFAEWGPGDMAMSMGVDRSGGEGRHPRLQEARDRVFAACKENGIAFLDGFQKETFAEQYAEGVRVSGYNEEVAEQVRTLAGRTMPV